MTKLLAKRYLDLYVSEGVSAAANQSLNWDLLKGLICSDVHAEPLVWAFWEWQQAQPCQFTSLSDQHHCWSWLYMTVPCVGGITEFSVIVPGGPWHSCYPGAWGNNLWRCLCTAVYPAAADPGLCGWGLFAEPREERWGIYGTLSSVTTSSADTTCHAAFFHQFVLHCLIHGHFGFMVGSILYLVFIWASSKLVVPATVSSGHHRSSALALFPSATHSRWEHIAHP